MKIGFIGGGIESEVVIVYIKRYFKVADMDLIYVYEDSEYRRNELRATYGVQIPYPNLQFVQNMDVVFLSEKLENLNSTLEKMIPYIKTSMLIVTMIPGLQISTVERYFPQATIVRIALNFPLIDQQGIIVFSTVGDTEIEEIENIAPLMTLFHDGGKMLRVSEEVMDIASTIVYGATFFQNLVLQKEVELLKKYGISEEDALQIFTQVKIGTSIQAQAGHTPLQEMKIIAIEEGDQLAKSMLDFFKNQSDSEFFQSLSQIFKTQFENLKSRSDNFEKPFQPPTEELVEVPVNDGKFGGYYHKFKDEED